MKASLLTFAIATLVAATPAAAQFGDPAALIAQEKTAMARIARFDGIWRGPAWTMLPTGRHDITQTERIGPFLDGAVKMIEGRGYNADGTTGFNALGVISYDPAKQAYNLHSYAQGYAGDFELKLNDTGYTWEIPAGPAMKILYTATITDSTWLEVGDRVMRGRPPIRFFEMNLKRVGSTNWPREGQVSVSNSSVPLLLGASDGETRVRRFGGAATEFTIKVDERNGGSPDFLMFTENILPGGSIPPHRHLLSDEILFIHSGTGTVEVGDKTGSVGAGGTVYIPANTRITLRNTGTVPLSIVGLFARQGFEDYLRETSALKGEPFVPLTPAELAAMRMRAEHHTVYERK